MKNILGILILITVFNWGCNKEKFQTKPQLFIKSINQTNFVIGDNVKIQLEFTDAEGDVQDTLWVMRRTRNCPSSLARLNDTSKLKIPNFTSTANQKGIFELNYTYGKTDPFMLINGCPGRNDTSFFRFWMKDKAGNRSDTVTTTNIVLLR